MSETYLSLRSCAVTGGAQVELSARTWQEPVGENEPSAEEIFARDRQRVVQARAFRRLAGKTQVFTSRGSDHFRSRLTHTIEVAQIAREVARALHLNEELVETLALAHDIGHPPFGHAGEHALDRCMQAHGLRFDHNLHALRIVEHFEDWYAAHRGLNLTLGVREGIIKHSRDYTMEKHPELAAYFLGQRPPVEAQVIDLVDEIAYLTADLDDGVESGLLTMEHIYDNVRMMGRAYGQVSRQHGGAEERFLFHEALQVVQRDLTADLITTTARNVRQAGLESLQDVRHYAKRVAAFSEGMEAQRRQEKEYLYGSLYTCPTLEAEHSKAQNVVATVFHAYMKDPTQMPAGYVEQSALEGLPRVVADYIAGMTDSFILQQFWTVSKRQRQGF